MDKKTRWVNKFIIGTFVGLYAMVSLISTIHVIDFFLLSNPLWLAITIAIAFEVGAAASLASIIVLDKISSGIVWSLFFLLTFMQAMGNTYYAFTNLGDFATWSQLFGIDGEDLILQKRVLAILSGAVLPIVALGFIKSLVDYIRPPEKNSDGSKKEDNRIDPLEALFDTSEEPLELVKEDAPTPDSVKKTLKVIEKEKQSLKPIVEETLKAKKEIEDAKPLYDEAKTMYEDAKELYEKTEKLVSNKFKESSKAKITEKITQPGLYGEEKFTNKAGLGEDKTPGVAPDKPIISGVGNDYVPGPKHIRGSKGDNIKI